MSDNERRIIDYDAFNDLPPNSWLIVDSEGQGTGKIAPIKIGATYEIQDGAHSFTLVGSNGYTHTVDIPYDSVQMSYADYQALTEVQKMDGTNRFVPDVPTDDLEPEIWQRVGRTPLTTEEKTISPAINELKGRIDDSDTEIEDIKSNLTELDTAIEQRLKLTEIRALATWNIGSSYTFTEEVWNSYTEFHLFIAHANMQDPSYYEIVFNRYFFSFGRIVGYGSTSAQYAQFRGDGSQRKITLIGAKAGGADYNPTVAIFAR